MLKNTNNVSQDEISNEKTHMSYDNYRKRTKRKSHKDLMVFISVLAIGILIFLGFAKILSPNVDVGIAGNEEYSEFEDEGIAGSIDERLKHLRDEDDKGTSDKIFSPELDEKVVLPNQMKKTVDEMEAEMQDTKSQHQKAEDPSEDAKVQKEEKTQIASKQDSKTGTAAINTTSFRVVVGHYATDKQAEVAKSIIQDAGLGITPVVKNLGGSYTLQVGVYSTREKAQQEVNNLLKNNFPARIAE